MDPPSRPQRSTTSGFKGWPDRKAPYTERKRKKAFSVQFSKGDEEILADICEKLGVGFAEAIRTSVRVYAALLNHDK